MDIGCTLTPSPEAPALAEHAERRGYAWVWINDSPANYPNPWVTLDRIAARTREVHLGPAVLSPSLRHVMTVASAIATLEQAAPGRSVAVVGSGFAAPRALGQPPAKLRAVGEYIERLRGLLGGRRVDNGGRPMQMLQPEGWVAERPVNAPILMAASGVKAVALAREVADGIVSSRAPQAGCARAIVSLTGTVLDEGEALGASRVMEAVGPAIGVRYRVAYEERGLDGVSPLPGGREWAAPYERMRPSERGLALHRGHYAQASGEDRSILCEEAVSKLTFTGTHADLRRRLGALGRAGATGVTYHPVGPDIVRELDAFADMSGLRPRSESVSAGVVRSGTRRS